MESFEYHTFLHHSQTTCLVLETFYLFEYHTFLHHSQTIRHRGSGGKVFEYHTFLHHSQTMQPYHLPHSGLSTIHFYIILKQEPKEQCWVEQFEYHTFLHHSQTVERSSDSKKWFEYHTFLHHSQTKLQDIILNFSLSTIHFYIILKLSTIAQRLGVCLSTIHFYIILKPIPIAFSAHIV